MSALPTHKVSAFNTAKSSENKIHDDATAQKFGFKGGLVGGVHVYAYMTHLPVARWGRAWLERGTGEARFGKPVYEGDIAEISGVEDAEGMATLQHGTHERLLPLAEFRDLEAPEPSAQLILQAGSAEIEVHVQTLRGACHRGWRLRSG